MDNFGLSGGIPWLHYLDGTFCLIFGCSFLKQNFLSLWRNLKLKITVPIRADGVNICWFIDNFDRHHNRKVPLLLVVLYLPIHNVINWFIIKTFIVAAVSNPSKSP